MTEPAPAGCQDAETYARSMRIHVFIASPEGAYVVELPCSASGLAELADWTASEWFVGAVLGHAVTHSQHCVMTFDAGGVLLGKIPCHNALPDRGRRRRDPASDGMMPRCGEGEHATESTTAPGSPADAPEIGSCGGERCPGTEGHG